MAIAAEMNAPTQYRLSLLPETTLGTLNKTSMHLVNLKGMPSFNRPAVRALDVRHGVGQTAKTADAYVNEFGEIKEISFSALYDQTLAPILISNCMGVAIGTSPASFDIPCNFTTVECKHDDTDNDSTGALTVATLHPNMEQSTVFPGCFVDTFKMSANVSDDGGRFKMDATLKSRHNPDYTGPTASLTLANSDVPYQTFRTIYDLATKISLGGNDVVMNSFEITINSQVKFYGCGVNGIPQTIGRGFPEIIATGVFGVKMDDNTYVAYRSQSRVETDFAVEISNHATWASASFGVKGTGSISEDFNIEEVEGGAFIKIPVKFLAGTTGDLLQIIP